MIHALVHFFDKLEDKIRIGLSQYPILYASIAALGIILVWKGIWETAALVPALFGPASILLGMLLLLSTGLLVSVFVGDSIILSGLKREKKVAEQTEKVVTDEQAILESISQKLTHLEKDLSSLKTRSSRHRA